MLNCSVDVLCFFVALVLVFGVILIIALKALPLDSLPQLSYEKLEVYQKSIQLLVLSTQVLANAPRGHAELCDQLKRAALSVPLNFAEAGSFDKAKHYSIARASALEYGAIFDVFHALQILDPKLYRQAKLLIVAEGRLIGSICFSWI